MIYQLSQSRKQRMHMETILFRLTNSACDAIVQILSNTKY